MKLKNIALTIASIALIGAGCSGTGPQDTGSEPAAAQDKMSAEVVKSKLTSAGVAFTQQDDTAKRKAVFTAKNQAVIDSIAKFKFGSSSVQLSVVDASDASRQSFIGADLLGLYNQVTAADATYQRSYATLSLEDDNTNLLLIFKPADAELAKKIEKALK
jgi:hypothetical protein